MIKVLFICHGNICRSPMAEFIVRDTVRKKSLADLFSIESAATSTEEIGNPVHPGTRRKLLEHGISSREISCKQARQMTRADYDRFDYLIGMDHMNQRNVMRILRSDPQEKVHLLLDFTDRKGDIADPWYTGNFEETYRDICEGCDGLLAWLSEREPSLRRY